MVPSAATFDEAVTAYAAALEELKTLEAEHTVGELGEAEFHARRDQARITAAKALREQDRLRAALVVKDDAALEAEVLAARKTRSSTQSRCQLCGSPIPPNGAECPRCGTPVAKKDHASDKPNT